VTRLKDAFGEALDQSKALVDIQDELNRSGAAFEISQEAFDSFTGRINELRSQLTNQIIDPEQFNAAIKDLKAGLDLQVKFDTRVAEITADRLEKLSKVSQEPLRVQDIRSGGIDEFLRIASGREDPSIEEARKQTRELQGLRAELRLLGVPVEI